jgi:hypothetical protein
MARSIAVSNGKVYIAGRYNDGAYNKACYWINGVKTDLQAGVASRATSIAVDDGKVYVTGFYYDRGTEDAPAGNYGCYWVDGARTNLEDAYINGAVNEFDDTLPIAVYRGKVYVVGWSKGSMATPAACIWVNGAKRELSVNCPAGCPTTFATAIVVK